MRKRILAVFLSIAMVFMIVPTAVQAEDEALGTTRTGIETGKTYTIGTPQELFHFANLVNSGKNGGATFVLTNNIDATKDADSNPVNWTPINNFVGLFDGGGFVVTIHVVSVEPNCGLFGWINSGGKIMDTGVSGTVSGTDYVGGIAGWSNSIITNCFNSAIITGTNHVGGVAGYSEGNIRNCYNTAAVSGNRYVGGVTGRNYSVLENSYNTGSVTGTGSNSFDIGGAVGLSDDSMVRNCYNTGIVSAGLDVTGIGGIVGENRIGTGPVLQGCYWLTSSCTNGIGAGGYAGVYDAISFDSQGNLTSAIRGQTTLVGILNWRVTEWQKNENYGTYTPWKAGNGTGFPVFMEAPDITTTSLSSGVINTAYSASLSATGDTSTWSLAAGALPPGLMLAQDGNLMGTPTAAGAFSFTVHAVNGAGTDTQSLSMVIKGIQIPLSITGAPAAVTYGDAPFSVGTSGGSGTGKIDYTVVNQTDLCGAAATGIASLILNNDGTATVTILKAGKFQISADKAEDDIYTIGSTVTSETIIVNKKAVTITGIGAADKTYDGNTSATITGKDTATITGNIDGANLTIDSTSATASFVDEKAGSNRAVTFSGFALSGSAASNYTLLEQPAVVTANINKADPAYTAPSELTAIAGQTLSDIGIPQPTGGIFTWEGSNSTSVGEAGNNTFKMRYTPNDTANYKTITGIEITVAVRRASIVPNPDTDNHITGITAGEEVTTGNSITFTAIGGGMDNTSPLSGDVRYVPVSWSMIQGGTWAKAPYTATVKMETADNYTLTVTYSKEMYNGTEWVSSDEEIIKEVGFKVTVKETPITSESQNGNQNDNADTGDHFPTFPLAILFVASAFIGIANPKRRKA